MALFLKADWTTTSVISHIFDHTPLLLDAKFWEKALNLPPPQKKKKQITYVYKPSEAYIRNLPYKHLLTILCWSIWDLVKHVIDYADFPGIAAMQFGSGSI